MNFPSIDFVLLIPCYNNPGGLLTSLKSIVYPKTKFEVLIVDDGSVIPVNMAELQQQLEGMRIHIIRLDRNQGIVNALNTGLYFLKSRNDVKYIARLDASDTCNEQRFYKQVDFLDKHKEIALLASWARFENHVTGTGYNYVTKTTHEEILKEMHYKCSFIHPSVMFRKEVLGTIGFYPDNYIHAEDYAFFWQLLKRYKSAVIPENLIKIRYTDSNVSGKNYKQQLRSRKRIVKEFGTNWLYKMIGVGMLNIKGVLPRRIIQKWKSV